MTRVDENFCPQRRRARRNGCFRRLETSHNQLLTLNCHTHYFLVFCSMEGEPHTFQCFKQAVYGVSFNCELNKTSDQSSPSVAVLFRSLKLALAFNIPYMYRAQNKKKMASKRFFIYRINSYHENYIFCDRVRAQLPSVKNNFAN